MGELLKRLKRGKMDKKTEQAIIDMVVEQIELKNVEAFAGNIVKEEFHKGVVFGIKMVIDSMNLEFKQKLF